MKTIVVSAVNLRKGGTLTILKDCLQYLSALAATGEYRIVALVHKRELCDYPRIEYIEMPWTLKSWFARLWCEYVTMYSVSKNLAPVYLWLSLHDTTPRVKAERRAVYCQTSFPFLKWKFNDLKFDYKIVLFALFTRLSYRINIHRNSYLIVQTNWLRDGFSRMFSIPKNRFIVAPPEKRNECICNKEGNNASYNFIFAATPDCHKNFETLCQAARLLEEEVGKGRFKVALTIAPNQNKYTEWLWKNWGDVSSIEFAGFLPREELYRRYGEADCLVFPSRVETWGLPISEFAVTGKPMLLADLPYAHETAAGSMQTAFFQPQDAGQLKNMMKRLMEGDNSMLHSIERKSIEEPKAESWKELFDLLLS